MGFFSRSDTPAEPADPRLVATLIGRDSRAEDILAKESAAIVSELDGETCLAVAVDSLYRQALVVTDTRSLVISKGKIDREICHGDVARVHMRVKDNKQGHLLALEPHAGRTNLRREEQRVAGEKMIFNVTSHQDTLKLGGIIEALI